MTKRCWYVTYTNCAGQSGDGYFCSELIEWRTSGQGCGNGYFYSADLGFNAGNASELSGSVTAVDCSNCPGCCAAEPKYDCLNGGCVNSSTYGTPGKYNSLSECEGGCLGDGKPCTGECVDAATVTRLDQVVSRLAGKFC
jgi:hypothetical protein